MSDDLRNFDLREGDLLAGKFRVERLLGSGGMGVVVEATHVTLKDRVALKFLRTPKFADQTTITRFLREAQAAARIKSPHVARVLDVGTLEDGSPYMVMEFLDGTDLGTVLDRDGTLPIDQAISYALQTCEALAAAHASGVVHRDVKPSNLFLTHGPDRTPLVKVLDFGISKLLDGTTSGSITETQRAVGSPSYMAPEQMRSAKRVDARADIWSMGVVLYEFFTGRAPFIAETIPELYALILDKASRPTPLRGLRAEVPEELERVVERCLEKNANDRYPDVAELAAALAPFGGEFGPISAARTRRILEASSVSSDAARSSDRAAPKPPAETSGGGANPRTRSDIAPATVREGRPLGSTSRSERRTPSSHPGRTATSFAETQSPPRKQHKVLAASIGVTAVGAAILGLIWSKVNSDLPKTELSTPVLQAPAALQAAREPVPQPSPAAAPPVDPSAALSAPSASASPPSGSASASAAGRTAPGAASATPRAPHPKASGTPASDDVLLHRK